MKKKLMLGVLLGGIFMNAVAGLKAAPVACELVEVSSVDAVSFKLASRAPDCLSKKETQVVNQLYEDLLGRVGQFEEKCERLGRALMIWADKSRPSDERQRAVLRLKNLSDEKAERLCMQAIAGSIAGEYELSDYGAMKAVLDWHCELVTAEMDAVVDLKGELAKAFVSGEIAYFVSSFYSELIDLHLKQVRQTACNRVEALAQFIMQAEGYRNPLLPENTH